MVRLLFVIFVCKSCENILIVKNPEKFKLLIGDKTNLECLVCGKVSGEPMRRVY